MSADTARSRRFDPLGQYRLGDGLSGASIDQETARRQRAHGHGSWRMSNSPDVAVLNTYVGLLAFAPPDFNELPATTTGTKDSRTF
ncbi:hypothetical protein [Sphingomonas mollis]|uniref:Uncharacterized protein n=1 Tax=Sphingomonas mollis TaxID=2795726 RepID=A0ABS0XP43_9SPHN|nr:hypothetical protein [Sphingomonas sp. BT553]MBJ6121811.1 hypothetical protein [Sphingomonas sp. BT553]